MATNKMATNLLGTTKARRFQLTLNEVDKYEKLKEYLTGLKSLSYLISCKENAPTTGHEHIHIFICLSSPLKLSLKKCCGAHVEYCKGTIKQNINYIKKDGNILDEIGEIPRERGGCHTVEQLANIEDLRELHWNEYNTWKKIKADKENDIDIDDWKKDIKVYYIQGPSGVGKTEKAKEIARENAEKYGKKINIVKFENGFWMGVGSAKIAIYDDFRDSHLKASEFINFIDYNKHIMNIKGGSKQNKYNLIIITSVQPIENIYSNMTDEPRKQWLRRVNVIDMYNEHNEVEDLLEDDI
nr:replication-associated protein [Cressdnaviricota sp.]